MPSLRSPSMTLVPGAALLSRSCVPVRAHVFTRMWMASSTCRTLARSTSGSVSIPKVRWTSSEMRLRLVWLTMAEAWAALLTLVKGITEMHLFLNSLKARPKSELLG
eukprot:4675995-Lingulodinium_polyedra.AAC.1